MARKADPKNAVWIVGRVRIVERGDRYRILWTEGGRQRERTASSLSRAKEIAVAEMERLELNRAEAEGGEHRVPFGALVADVLQRKQHGWAPEWFAYNERMAKRFILPEVGALSHDQVTAAHLQGVLNKIAVERGYGFSFINHCRKLLSKAVARGVELGLYKQESHPARDLHVPKAAGEATDGINVFSIPTDEQVEMLIKLADDYAPMYGAMVRVAAYTGLRWGELLGLTRHDLDFDRNILWVRRTCQESQDGFRFKPISVKKGGPQPRRVALDEVSDAIADWMKQVPENPPNGNLIIGDAPAGRLFYAQRTGNPIRRSNHTQRIGKLYGKVPGWPEGATWHTLRHYAITRWINLGVEPMTVSKWAGHGRNPVTTWNWYLGEDEGAFERGRGRLRR